MRGVKGHLETRVPAARFCWEPKTRPNRAHAVEMLWERKRNTQEECLTLGPPRPIVRRGFRSELRALSSEEPSRCL